MRDQARVVVIGGGAMGCSLLYHLTKLGWTDVVLVEKNELTAGSTWHAAGLCTHYAHNITVMNLRAHSAHLYKSLLEQDTGQPVGFHACGALRVTRHKDRLDEFHHVQGIGRFAGFDFHMLSPTELKDIYPLVRTDELLGAIYEPLDGHVDPSQATQAMAKGARMAGAEIYRHNPVNAIECTTSGEWRVRTQSGDIRAEIIVNAAGTWCREIGNMMGMDLPVVPILHQYVVTDRIQAFAELDRELPMIRDPDESWYLRQEGTGVIVGPYEHNGIPWSIDGVPSDFGMELLPPDLGRVQDIVAMAMKRVPAAADGGLKRIVNGPITFTPDANPLIGPAFDVPNAYLLTGSSMGVMEGGGAGKFLAEWIVAGEPPMDPIAIDPRRFGGYADREYRVDKAVECFAAQFAIHYPYEERPAGRPKRVTPVFEAMRDRGAVFGSVYGWERPNWFARAGEVAETVLSFQHSNWFDAVARECATVRDSVALVDLSVFSKFEVSGNDAARFIEGFGANRMPRRTGDIALTHCLTPGGGVLSEFTVTRLGENRFYLVSAAAAERHNQDLLKCRSRGLNDIRTENLTARYGVLGLMGPRSRDVLAQLTDDTLDNDSFPWLSAREIIVAGVSVRALRVSYVGELGWELHHPMDQQLQLFNALMEAGKKFEMGTFGAFAMNAMRLEKGYRAWGADLTTERTPLEAGMKFFVKTNGRDFVGRESMLRRAAEPAHWQMHLLQLDANESDPFYAHTVFVDDHPIGIVTSGGYGHRVGKPLALAYFREAPAVDSGLSVSILDQRVAARVLKQPSYDPGNRHLRG